MISRDALDGAVSRGILSHAQADDLLLYLAERERQPAENIDAEEVRFTKGFHDIFISLGLLIVYVGYAISAEEFFPKTPWGMAGFFSVAAIGVIMFAYWFTKKQRLALPSILLTGIFMTSVAGAGMALAMTLFDSGASFNLGDVLFSEQLGKELPFTAYLAIGAGVALVAGYAHYVIYRVPITPALLAISGIFGVLSLLDLISSGLVEDYLEGVVFTLGLLCFALAMYFDMKDVRRVSLNTDKAFWLHMLAAPLLVHSVLYSILSEGQSLFSAVIVLGLVLMLALIALVVDRRAILVAALSYTGFAIASLLESAELSQESLVSMSMIILGLFVLTLGFGWSSVRRIVMIPLEGTRLAACVPNTMKRK